MKHLRLPLSLAALCVAAFACDDGGGSNAQQTPADMFASDSGPGDTGPTPDGDVMDASVLLDAAPDAGEAPDMGPPAPFQVRPGVEVVTVTGVEAGAPMTLLDADGAQRVTIIADAYGQAHFAYLPTEHLVFESGEGSAIPVDDGTTVAPGTYSMRNEDTGDVVGPFEVLDVLDPPEDSFFEGRSALAGFVVPLLGEPQQAPIEGFTYLTMRDGVQLSAMVRFPDPLLYGQGPWPTVIEYSGYSTSRPDSMEPGTRIANALGYATVSVNMRGTGCSGGVFDVFNPAQHADGYDIVETVARQPWVLGNRVGMVGLSYSGIAQLFVARTNPPSLAAVTPLSVIADPWQQQWPGGVYNQGFTRSWLDQRDSQASAGGQTWTNRIIEGGDVACEAHQQLRSQNVDFEPFLRALEFYREDAADRSLPRLVPQIGMPVFLAGAFQDEQTGAQFGNMLDRFANAPLTRFTVYNGRHPDGYAPAIISRWFEFLELYVARRVPRLHPAVRQVGGMLFDEAFGVSGLDIEPDRFVDFADDDYAGVLAAFEAEPPVRVLFESGAHPDYEVGAPVARFEAQFDRFPPPVDEAWTLYLDAGGALVEAAPDAEGIDDYHHDPAAGPEDFFGEAGYQLTAALWDIDWTDYAEGDQLAYLTAPLEEDKVMLGPSVVDLWFASEASDVNIQVSLSVVRPDGTETWISSGWLRAGHRGLDEALSDDWRVERTFREADFEPLVPGEPTRVQIPIPPAGQAFRAGEQIRLTIATPGRNHGTWTFENPSYDGERPVHSVLRGGVMASQIRLPLVNGIAVPPDAPACPSLRGQPCRPYAPVVNSERAP